MAGLNTLNFFTDSAGSHDLGCGAYFQGSCFFLPWLAGWGLQLRNKKVVFNVDNLALVSAINKETTKSKRLMELVRHFLLGFMENNVVLKAKHISIVDNKITALSNGNI